MRRRPRSRPPGLRPVSPLEMRHVGSEAAPLALPLFAPFTETRMSVLAQRATIMKFSIRFMRLRRGWGRGEAGVPGSLKQGGLTPRREKGKATLSPICPWTRPGDPWQVLCLPQSLRDNTAVTLFLAVKGPAGDQGCNLTSDVKRPPAEVPCSCQPCRPQGTQLLPAPAQSRVGAEGGGGGGHCLRS